MATYSDTFTGADGSPLGNIEVGGIAWQAVAGTWTRTGGRANSTATGSSNPFAVIDVGVGEVDLSVNVGIGGDALYFRATDASNWLRARTYYYTTTSTTSSTSWDGTYDTTAWAYQFSGYVYSGDSSFPPGTHYYNNSADSQASGIADAYDQTASTPSSTQHSYDRYTRSVTKHMVTTTSSSTDYHYVVYLEKCVAGTITTLGSYTGSAASNLRVVASGGSIQVYVSGTQRISVTDTFNQAASKHGVGYGDSVIYSHALDNFSLDPLIPPVPVIVAPANNSTVTTGVPTLTSTVNAFGGTKTKIEYQIAQDSGFTTGLQTIREADASYRISGNGSIALTSAQMLTQRSWYIRARQIAASGLAGNWTSANAFTVSHAPGAINLTPTGGAGVSYSSTARLDWDFQDTSSIDSQSAYQAVVERNDTGALVVDSGKIVSSDTFYDAPIPVGLKDVQLRWKLTVWDQENKPSATTNYQIFVPADPPTVVITDPPDGGQVTTSRPTMSWTFSGSGGRTESYYRVTVALQGAADLLFDSLQQSGTATSYSVSSPVIENAKTYVITLYVTDSIGITVTKTSTVNAVYEAPTVVPFSVDISTYESNGYVNLSWQAVTDASFIGWRIYRRKLGVSDWTLLEQINYQTVTEYHDWLVPAMNTYEYYVVQVVERFNTQVESVVASSITVSLGTGGYWLIDTNDSSNNARLYSVTDETYTKNHEQAEYTIVGRGRHVDEGERIGKSGSMAAKLRSSYGVPARSKKEAIESLRERGIPVYLRNPFGDIDYIALGDIGVSRIAGTGSDEFVDVTIPYLEVF